MPIETRLTTPEDAKLATSEADVVLIVNTYHHIENRPEYFAELLKKLSVDSKLVIVDFKKEDLPVGPPINIKLSEVTVIEELIEAGFNNIHIDNSSLIYQYIITAW